MARLGVCKPGGQPDEFYSQDPDSRMSKLPVVRGPLTSILVNTLHSIHIISILMKNFYIFEKLYGPHIRKHCISVRESIRRE